MLVTFCLMLLQIRTTYADTKVIYSSDPSIAFSSGWNQKYSTPTQDLYMQTDSTNASLTATLPSSATSVSYVAYKRAGGSLYGYCIDCQDDESWTLQTSNASDPSVTDEDTAVESILFTIDLDPSTQHKLTVYNLPDSHFNNSSEINLDHLYVEVEDNDTGTTADPSTLDSAPISSSPIPLFPTSSIALSASTSSTAPTSTGSTGSGTAVDSGATLPFSPSSTATTSTGSTGSGTAVDPGATLPLSPSSTAGAANAASSSAAGLSKSLITGISVLSVVLGISIIVGLVVFLRQRRQQRRNSFQSSQSPRASIIPIMPPPPPDMRTASLNPFADPSPRALESPVLSTLMQRRMESRNTSPGTAPTIPLPDPPLDSRTESRSDSPASSFSARNDLWIARPVQTPLKSKFSV